MGLIPPVPTQDKVDKIGGTTDVSAQAQAGPGGQRSSSNNQSGTRTYASASSGEYKSILDLISSVEAPSYDTVNQGHIDGLSKMTIAEARLAAMNTSGSGAMGRYQQMPQFVLGRAKAAGLDPNKDLFDARNQDLLAIKLIDQAGYKKWKGGSMTTEKFAYNLAGTWRGLPEGPSNLTFQDQYAGDNKARTTWSNVMSVLGGTQSQPAPTMQPTSQQPATDVSPMAGGAQPAQLSRQVPAGQQTLVNKVPFSQFSRLDGGGSVGLSSQYKTASRPNHSGIDIGTSGQKGYYVALKADGKVTVNQYGPAAGNMLFIKVGNLEYVFMHLARPSQLKVGDSYSAGTPIGEIGNTGRSFGEHLHFEVRPAGGGAGTGVDPNPYLKMLEIGKLGTSDGTETQQVELSPNQQPTDRAQAVSSRPSYDPMTNRENAGGIVPIPIPGQQQMSGGGGRGMAMGGPSTQQVLNSYYKSQLMGFLYKQG